MGELARNVARDGRRQSAGVGLIDLLLHEALTLGKRVTVPSACAVAVAAMTAGWTATSGRPTVRAWSIATRGSAIGAGAVDADDDRQETARCAVAHDGDRARCVADDTTDRVLNEGPVGADAAGTDDEQ